MLSRALVLGIRDLTDESPATQWNLGVVGNLEGEHSGSNRTSPFQELPVPIGNVGSQIS